VEKKEREKKRRIEIKKYLLLFSYEKIKKYFTLK
jgi:hypothetical protein